MPSSSSSDSDNDAWASDASSASSSSSSASSSSLLPTADDDGIRTTDAPVAEPPPVRLRLRHGRKSSVTDAIDASARAYGEALRSVRASSHRASISMPSTSGSIILSDDTRRRHRESKRRLECADLTQRLLVRAYELDQFIELLPLWLHARIILPRWRVQIAAHLTPIHAQMRFCRDRIVAAWHLLCPPFDRANLNAFVSRLDMLERTVAALDAAIRECQDHVRDGEQTSASTFLQLWYRRCLARRGFYTKTVKVNSRQSRGLIPGLFDTIAATSRLTVHTSAPHRTTLEYPISPTAAKHAFLQ